MNSSLCSLRIRPERSSERAPNIRIVTAPNGGLLRRVFDQVSYAGCCGEAGRCAVLDRRRRNVLVSLSASSVSAKFSVFFASVLAAAARTHGSVGTINELATPQAGLQVCGVGGSCRDSIGKHDAGFAWLCKPACVG